MPVTLAQAKLNATDDIDVNVIDEFAKNNYLLETMTFDDVVNQAGAGATLTYGYTRLVSQPTADFRAINSEYTPAEVTKARYTVDLKPLGGSFQIDRVNNRIAAAAETTLQMQQKIKGTQARFNDAVINGDTAVDANGFDGLSKSLAASSTEYGAAVSTDWRGVTIGADAGKANDGLDALDAWLSMLDGPADAILGNIDSIARIRSLARRAGYYDRSSSAFGTQVETYRGIPFVDLGAKAGSNNLVIPTTSKTVATVAGNYTDIYALRFGLDGFHGVSMAGAPLVQTWLPDFSTSGAVKTGEVELGPAAVVLKRTKAAAVFRNILVR
ncbi:major capsid protein [Streptomyces zhihengii]|uniref:Phage capsid protein n=1 Tax=Streptomyces zhihengii TaxID=1818004 RepID=A0ABS2UUB3_9ACTN|nr:phage capsid protein [Streptomyces zhihengii]MBM9621023.1 phage capsid protein [Streptomyces zhihengii]